MNKSIIPLSLFLLSVMLFLSNKHSYSQGIVTDIDGNTYPTVTIGDQEWMAEDLRVTRYRNGDALLFDQSFKDWQKSTEGIWTYYDNDPTYNTLYGKLYNWYATVDERGLCPTGWRTPTDHDWFLLEEFIDPTHRGNKDDVGKKLKSRRQVNSPFGGEYNTSAHPRWDDHPVNYGTDEYNFNSLPGGGYTNGNAYRHLGQQAYYWSASEAIPSHAWTRILTFSNSGMSRGQLLKSLGASVRCVKGVEQTVQVPQVNTKPAANITLSSATSGGDVLADGGAAVTARGVVWSTSQNPKVDYNLGITVNGSGLGEFSSEITGLLPGTTYWVRAYATNSAGTAYGIQVKVTTFTQSGLPTVTTSQATNVSSLSALSGGNVTSEGGLPVTARGVVWNTIQNPTLEANLGFTTEGLGLGMFYSSIVGLSPDITYNVRAYATNSEGTAYGNNVTFKTNASVNPDDCLVAWYPFNGNANDESGFDNHGIVNGAALVNDRHGTPNSAYLFDGNDWIEALHQPQIDFGINDEYTISLWAKISTSQINYGTIIDKWVNSYNPYPYVIRCYGPSSSIGTSIIGARYIGGLPQDYTRNQTLRLSDGEMDLGANKYHNIVIVFTPDIMKLFINGILAKTSTNQMLSGDVSNTYKLFIGRRSGREDRFFYGEIDDIKIYNCALDEASIYNIYNEESIVTSELTLIANPEPGGILTGAGIYPAGAEIDIIATTNQGYRFINWEIDGEVISTEASFTFTMPAEDVTVTANFEEDLQPWNTLNSGINATLYSVFFIDEEIGFACGINGTIIKTINGGNNWELLNSGTTDQLNEVFFINYEVGFAVGGIHDGGVGSVLKTIDGGITWTYKTICNNALTGIYMIDSQKGFVTGGFTCGTGLFRTVDGGENWVSVTNPNSTLWNWGVHFLDENFGAVVGSYDKFIKTDNGGDTWNGGATMSSSNHTNGIWLTSELVGFTAGPLGLKKTIDGGNNWYYVFEGSARKIRFIDTNIGYFSGGKYMYKSTDAGESWSMEYIAESAISNTFFINENLGFAVGDNGLILKYENY